jgi:nitrogen fixation NifU-like protein
MWLNDDKRIEDIPMGEAEDKFVRELQEQIFEETKEAYGETAFHRWLDPLHMGAIKEPDGYACVTGVCGDTMQIFLRFENDRVKEASFQADGCGSSIVCGSFAAEMSLGKNPDELLEVTSEAILKKLEKLPKEDEHCASLAAETLQEALNDYMIKHTTRNN